MIFFSLVQLVNEVIYNFYINILEVNASITCNIAENAVISSSKRRIRQVLKNIILNALDVVLGMPSPSIYISGSESPPKHSYFKYIRIMGRRYLTTSCRIFLSHSKITTKKEERDWDYSSVKIIVLRHRRNIILSLCLFLTTFFHTIQKLNNG